LVAKLGDKDESGRVWTWGTIIPLLEVILDRPTSVAAQKSHRSKHCRVVRDGESEEPEGDGTAAALLAGEQAALLAEIDDHLSEGRVNPTRVRQLQARGALLALRRDIAKGAPMPALSPDQLGRVLEGLEKRQTDQERNELLTALGGGISKVFEKALGPAAPEPRQIDPAVIEVEVTDESESES
jgi:hypothetical protein